jgi:epoxyqueuosine reductase
MISTADIKSRARSLGFDLCGIAPATALPELAHLQEWLARGYAGEMTYLERSAAARADIRHVLPSAQSVIVTGTVYYTDDRAEARSLTSARIARYAWGEDYHLVLSKRLEALVAWMREASDSPFESFIFVDKHHVQERVFAKHAGLGWIGKNTCLINPDLGSWLFLAGVAVSLDLPADAAGIDQCGACTQCIDACPTGAIVDEYEIDATRCISYLTIELAGPIPPHQRASLGDHLFGCDICQDVCPWNLAPLATLDPAWLPRQQRSNIDAADLWQRSDFELHQLVEGSAMTRTSISRLRRNLAIVLGNSGDSSVAGLLDRPGHGDPAAARTAEMPLIHEHVEWAKQELSTRLGAPEVIGASPPDVLR